MIRLVIFDFDGVLAPLNYGIILEVYRYIAEQMKLSQPWGDSVESFKQWFTPEYLRNLHRMGGTRPEQIRQAEQLFRDYLNAHRYNLFPEYDQILPQLQKHFALAIVSNGPELRAKLELQHRCDWFRHIIGKESLQNRFKPDPYGIQLCLERLQVLPAEAMIIGDDPGDIKAGLKAGLRYNLGVAWGVGDAQDLLAAGANRILYDRQSLQDFHQLLDELEKQQIQW